jgi:hypothetical protein
LYLQIGWMKPERTASDTSASAGSSIALIMADNCWGDILSFGMWEATSGVRSTGACDACSQTGIQTGLIFGFVFVRVDISGYPPTS